MIVGKLVFDLARYSVEKTIRVKQYDREKRQLLIALLNDGEPYNIAENSTVRIECRKPDGTEILNDCTFVNNLVTAEVSEQMTTCAGIAECAISIYELDSYIASWTFNLKVDTSVITANGMTSENEYQSLIKKFNEIDTTEQELSDAIEVGSAVLEAADSLSADIEEARTEISEVSDAVEFIKEFEDLNEFNDKLDKLNDHTTSKVSSEEGVHGLRVNTDSLDVLNGDGEWENIRMATPFYQDGDRVALLDSFDMKTMSFVNKKWYDADFETYPVTVIGYPVVLKGELHILGEFYNSNNKCHYKLDGNSWVKLSDMPYNYETNYRMATVFEDEIHVIFRESGRPHYKWDETTDTWIKLANTPYDCVQGNLIVYKDELHLVGGNGNGGRAKWNKETDTWTTLPDLPIIFSSGAAVAFRDELHLILLYSNGLHYKYNDETNTVTQVSTFPLGSNQQTQFYMGGCTVHNDKIYLAGGGDKNRNPRNACCSWDGETWTTESSIHTPMFACNLVSYNNNLYLTGGATNSSASTFTNKFTHYSKNKNDTYIEMVAKDNEKNIQEIGKLKINSIVA